MSVTRHLLPKVQLKSNFSQPFAKRFENIALYGCWWCRLYRKCLSSFYCSLTSWNFDDILYTSKNTCTMFHGFRFKVYVELLRKWTFPYLVFLVKADTLFGLKVIFHCLPVSMIKRPILFNWWFGNFPSHLTFHPSGQGWNDTVTRYSCALKMFPFENEVAWNLFNIWNVRTCNKTVNEKSPLLPKKHSIYYSY